MQLDGPPANCRNPRMCWLGKAPYYDGKIVVPAANEISPEPVEDDDPEVQLDLLTAIRPKARQPKPTGETRYTNGRWHVFYSYNGGPASRSWLSRSVDVCVACWITLWADWVNIMRDEVNLEEAYQAYLDRLEG